MSAHALTCDLDEDCACHVRRLTTTLAHARDGLWVELDEDGAHVRRALVLSPGQAMTERWFHTRLSECVFTLMHRTADGP